MGIQDPIRTEVPIAVEACRNAGITVRMVTGDNVQTAVAIARKCGIFEEKRGHLAMQGPEFRQLAKDNPERLMALLPRLRVLARSSPTDKHVLVGHLMEKGEVVGVTGDGTNDAPALKLANVGFAMASGTDVAKGASAMVLMDDNFATVVRATMWGRGVNDNIRKFLQFQLTVNFCGVLLTFIGAVISPTNEEPLKPVQLLWLNLIMDTLAALSLATEKPGLENLKREPVFKSAPLISRRMWAFILGHSAFQLAVMLVLLYLGHEWFDCRDAECPPHVGILEEGGYCRTGPLHSTVIFNTFIWMQVFNEMNARKLYGELVPFSGLFSRSKPMVLILILIAGIQVVAVQYLGKFMETTPLSLAQWMGCIALAFLELPVGFAISLIPVTEPRPADVDKVDVEKAEEIAEVVGNALGRFRAATNNVITAQRVVKSSVAFKRGDPSIHASKEAKDGQYRANAGRNFAVPTNPLNPASREDGPKHDAWVVGLKDIQTESSSPRNTPLPPQASEKEAEERSLMLKLLQRVGDRLDALEEQSHKTDSTPVEEVTKAPLPPVDRSAEIVEHLKMLGDRMKAIEDRVQEAATVPAQPTQAVLHPATVTPQTLPLAAAVESHHHHHQHHLAHPGPHQHTSSPTAPVFLHLHNPHQPHTHHTGWYPHSGPPSTGPRAVSPVSAEAEHEKLIHDERLRLEKELQAVQRESEEAQERMRRDLKLVQHENDRLLGEHRVMDSTIRHLQDHISRETQEKEERKRREAEDRSRLEDVTRLRTRVQEMERNLEIERRKNILMERGQGLGS